MKLSVRYPTKERTWISQHTYQNVYITEMLKPIRIFRRRCGRGAAENRYHYEAEFLAPSNAEFASNGVITCNIDRKNNRHFDPKTLTWIGNIAIISSRSSSRYVLHPGYVTSQTDGQRHFIGGPRLARLYGVNIRDCVFGDMTEYQEQEGDVHLRPRYDGNYTLPNNETRQPMSTSYTKDHIPPHTEIGKIEINGEQYTAALTNGFGKPMIINETTRKVFIMTWEDVFQYAMSQKAGI